MLRTLRLLILLVIFSSQYVYAESYMKDAQDGLPKAQYEYAMSLIEKGKKKYSSRLAYDCCSTRTPQE